MSDGTSSTGHPSSGKRQLKLGAVTYGTGGPGSPYLWLDEDIPVDASVNVNWYIEQARLAEAGLAAVEERDTTCCYARQDKFWVTGTPGGERWEIYTVLADSQTFWGQDGSQSWDAAAAALDDAPGGQDAQCCGGPRQASETGAAASITIEAGPGPHPAVKPGR